MYLVIGGIGTSEYEHGGITMRLLKTSLTVKRFRKLGKLENSKGRKNQGSLES